MIWLWKVNREWEKKNRLLKRFTKKCRIVLPLFLFTSCNASGIKHKMVENGKKVHLSFHISCEILPCFFLLFCADTFPKSKWENSMLSKRFGVNKNNKIQICHIPNEIRWANEKAIKKGPSMWRRYIDTFTHPHIHTLKQNVDINWTALTFWLCNLA